MNSKAFFAATLMLAAMFAWLATRSQAQRPLQLGSGGRPGEFHFILREQLDHNRAEFRDMRAIVERLRFDLGASTADPGERRRMQQDLDRLMLFVDSIDLQLSVPAGTTAAQVESRLNASKGQSMCGSCHGDLGAGTSPAPEGNHH